MRRNKKGFTVVELSIVIVVIAILAAILIPTMISLVNKANVANDTALVRNLNTALALDGGEKHETMQDALDAAKDAGYDVAKINAKATDNEILWDSANDVFCYMKDEDGKQTITYVPETTLSVKNVKNYQYWVVASAPSSTYSTYLYNYSGNGTEDITTGIDVGSETVSTINYANTGDAQNVILRTQGGKLTINDTNDASHQTHYGYVDSLEVATGNNCYVGHALVGEIVITQGKIVADEGAYIGIMKATPADGATITLEEKNEGVFTISSSASASDIADSVCETLGYTKSSEGETTTLTPSEDRAEKSIYKITDEVSLIAYREASGNGARVNAKLMDDIYLTKEWIPFGAGSRAMYKDTFDGNNKTIYNLTISSSGSYKGLFGQTNNNAVIKNLKLSNLKIDAGTGWHVGGLVGYAQNGITIENCTIDANSEIKANHRVGGIIGSVWGNSGSTYNISNVTNYATINANNNEAQIGGLLGQMTGSVIVNFADCHNYGKVIGNSYQGFTGGIVGSRQDGTLTFDNCSNNVDLGEFVGYFKGDLVGWSTYNTPSIIFKNCQITGETIGAVDASTDTITRTYTMVVDEIQKTFTASKTTDTSNNNVYKLVKFSEVWWGTEEAK